ncbi:S-layer homology domain-containing protein [Candidatus Gracilibacteria bacterium]|nr:S-layer homology domain-containing protein [Candidatus Gracilibacteria bacterium]
MKKNNLILSLLVSLLISNIAYAFPIVSSGEDQNFAQNIETTQLREISITDDAQTSYIMAGNLKITIPDSIEIIFDSERTKEELLIYGTAVDNGKVKATPAITFEDKDKTLVIPIDKNFAKGEKMVIKQIYAEGFHSQPVQSAKFIVTLPDGSKYYDLYDLYIQTGNIEDNSAPDMPTNIKLTRQETGVMISWTDPTDLDFQRIQIFKGVNDEAVSGTAIEVLKGVQQYLDKDITIGDKVKYGLKATDGKNYGSLTVEVSLTVEKYSPLVTPEPTTPVDTSADTPAEPTSPDTTQIPETTPDTIIEPTSSSSTCQTFSDIAPEDVFCTMLKTINKNNIITGYSDGTFSGDNQINRAELLKIALLYANIELMSPAKNEPIFSDVPQDEWYSNYIYTAKTLGIIDGYPNGTFKPAQTVNKAEAIKIILKALKAETGLVSFAPYEDTPINQNNAWYLPYAQYLKDTVDQNSTNLDPSHLMTRKEIVEILNLLAR